MSNIKKIWSNILSYKPYLYLNKKILDNDNHTMYENDITKYNVCIDNFVSNSPYSVYENMITNINSLKELINTISGKIDDVSNIEHLINSNRTITGNELYEVYNIINKDYKYLSYLSDKFINLFYKCNIDDIEKTENNYISNIKKLSKESICKINYMSLYYDTYICSMVSSYCDTVCNQDKEMYSEILSIDTYDNLDINSVKVFIESDFNNKTKTLEYNYNKYIDMINNNNLYKSIYKTCALKNKINKFNNDYSKLDLSDNNFLINKLTTIKENNINELESLCTDIFKTITLSIVYKNDYIDTLSYRHSCKNIYNCL